MEKEKHPKNTKEPQKHKSTPETRSAFEPKNIEQGMLNFEGVSLCVLRFLILCSLFGPLALNGGLRGSQTSDRHTER
jgi:hypothetical protein